MTEGERWAREAMRELGGAGATPAALARFLIASQRRANATRAARPELARQARRWLILGAAAYLPWRPRCALRWWAIVSLMLDWHLGMVESETGEPRRLGPADACTLLRAWIVPVVAAGPHPRLCALGLATDVLDGQLARATVPTRAGRDLDGVVDAVFVAAALRGSTVPTGAARLEQARMALGFAGTTAAYLRGSPRRRARRPAAALLRAAGLLSPDPRPAGSLVVAGGLLAVLPRPRRRARRPAPGARDPRA